MITKLGQEAIDYKSRLATILRNDYLKNYENKKVNPNKEGIIGYSQYRFSPDHNPLYARHYVDRTDFVDALPFGKKAAIGNIYDPYGIENADLIEKEYLEKLIQNNMARKASDTHTGWGKALGVGGGIGAALGIIPAIASKNISPVLVGGALGLGGGAIAKKVDDNAITQAREDHSRFSVSPEFRAMARANASGRSISDRMEEAHYNALARNDADNEMHSHLFGNQQWRGRF